MASAPALSFGASDLEKDMVLLPVGEFQMGSPDDAGFANEHPSHKVRLSAYWIDIYEVTAQQYRPYALRAGRKLHRQPCADEERCPVVYVNWDDAQGYCSSIGKRLPTEAEWERAARGGSQGEYSNGSDGASLGDYAWYAVNGDKRLHAVGGKKPNAFGIYDMHGNVLEWVSDYFAEDYYSRSAPLDPPGPEKGKYRVVRGGSVYLSAKLVRAAHRMKGKQSTRYSGRGFRCAASARNSK